uniref:Uncharacterized protein n=1 Tax=Ixodes ricinus TaxID=34613 RepID=A0A6B0UW74_IXORI
MPPSEAARPRVASRLNFMVLSAALSFRRNGAWSTKEPVALQLSSQAMLRIGMPLAMQERAFTVLRNLSVTRCVHVEGEAATSPPRFFTISSPVVSASPVNITLGFKLELLLPLEACAAPKPALGDDTFVAAALPPRPFLRGEGEGS